MHEVLGFPRPEGDAVEQLQVIVQREFQQGGVVRGVDLQGAARGLQGLADLLQLVEREHGPFAGRLGGEEVVQVRADEVGRLADQLHPFLAFLGGRESARADQSPEDPLERPQGDRVLLEGRLEPAELRFRSRVGLVHVDVGNSQVERPFRGTHHGPAFGVGRRAAGRAAKQPQPIPDRVLLGRRQLCRKRRRPSDAASPPAVAASNSRRVSVFRFIAYLLDYFLKVGVSRQA